MYDGITMPPVPRTFAAFLTLILTHGDKSALVDSQTGVTYTYRELVERIQSLATRLAIAPGERVLLYKLSQLDWVVLFFAVQLRGGIVVPVDDRVGDEFVVKVVEQTEPVYFFTSEQSQSAHILAKTHVLPVTDLWLLPELYEVVPNHGPDAPCEIIFTSGTWSDPKGVVLSQRNLLANVEQLLGAYTHEKNEVVLSILPLTHAYQQTLGLLTPLVLGSKIVFLKVTNSIELLQVIKRYRVTIIPLVPRVLELLYSAITRKISSRRLRLAFVQVVTLARYLPLGLRRVLFRKVHALIGNDLHVLVSGGSPLQLPIDRFFQGLGYQVMVGYGLSECSPIVCAHFGQHRVVGEVGQPLPGVQVTLNEAHEIIVRGENVYLGYWPDTSGTTTDFKTGDIGTVLPGGSVVLQGRNKNLIIFASGEKCFCEDFETLLLAVDEIEHCCVVEKKQNGVTVAEALCTTVGDVSIDVEAVRARVNKKLPFGISLSRLVWVAAAEFPLTHTLKPSRVKISALLDAE